VEIPTAKTAKDAKKKKVNKRQVWTGQARQAHEFQSISM
jgi:hypothetical protein